MWGFLLKIAGIPVLKEIVSSVIDARKEIWERIVHFWSGKSIAIIGPTATGKNSMFSKLKGEPPPIEYIQTRGAEKIDDFPFLWKLPNKSEIKFKCKRSINVGGEVDERERNWLKSCKGADVIFYLVDVERYNNDPKTAHARIKGDFKWMASNFQKFESHVTIHILFNKIDCLTSNIGVDEMESFIEKKLADRISEVEGFARKILGRYFERVTGITPISMSDEFLFQTYFTIALNQISNFQRSGK
jgi:tRNA U34 5-carboxymethylaminomethyl modifying GTPase MnmE/TrmE